MRLHSRIPRSRAAGHRPSTDPPPVARAQRSGETSRCVTSGYASKIGSHASEPGGSFAAASIISSRVGLGSLPSERDLLQIRVLRVVGRGRDGAARRLLPRRACRRRHSSQHGICVPRHFCREVIIIHLAFTAARAPAVSSSRTRRIAELQAHLVDMPAPRRGNPFTGASGKRTASPPNGWAPTSCASWCRS